jgi:hypothetical protein
MPPLPCYLAQIRNLCGAESAARRTATMYCGRHAFVSVNALSRSGQSKKTPQLLDCYDVLQQMRLGVSRSRQSMLRVSSGRTATLQAAIGPRLTGCVLSAVQSREIVGFVHERRWPSFLARAGRVVVMRAVGHRLHAARRAKAYDWQSECWRDAFMMAFMRPPCPRTSNNVLIRL